MCIYWCTRRWNEGRGLVASYDIAIHGELTMTPAGSDETVTESLKGIHVLERQADGSWKISHDIWNSNSH